MTIKNLTLTAAAVACVLGLSAANAREEPGQFYIAPLATYIDPDGDGDEGVEGGQLVGGYVLGDRWNVELALQMWSLESKSASSRASVDETGAVINVLNVYNRAGRFSPFLLAGVGYAHEDYSNVAMNNDDALQAQAGVGLLSNLFGDRVALRTEALYRWVDADNLAGNDDERDEFVFNFGVQVNLGPKKAPAPVAAAAPPPPPPAPVAPPPAPSDSDGDGVVDASDQCPDTPKGDRVGPQGCSCDVTRQVQFAFDSAELTDEGRATLDETAERLTQLKFVSGTVTGHTDSIGTEAYNQSLSEQRAQTVSDYLQDKGIGVGRLEVSGAGESQPVADNDSKEGRAQNRRVVLKRTDCEKSN